MALKMSTDLKNYLTESLVIAMAGGTFGTAGTGSGMIYDYAYTLNPDADAPTAGIGTMGNTFGWGTDSWASSAGTALLTTSIAGTSASDTTAQWGRLYCVYVGYTGSSATFCMDGSCGTAGSDFVFGSVSLGSAGTISMGTCSIGVGP